MQNQRIEIKSILDAERYKYIYNSLKLGKFAFYEQYSQRSINSIYFDDSGMTCYLNHTLGHAKRSKNRIRKYGNINLTELNQYEWTYELKSKLYNIGFKNREKTQLNDIIKRLKPLRPVVLISYNRFYFVNAHNIRVTIDTNLTYSKFINSNNHYFITKKIKKNINILEIKLAQGTASEAIFNLNTFINNNNLKITKFSKYCDAIESLRLINN